MSVIFQEVEGSGGPFTAITCASITCVGAQRGNRTKSTAHVARCTLVSLRTIALDGITSKRHVPLIARVILQQLLFF
jgi:hypothetical protein